MSVRFLLVFGLSVGLLLGATPQSAHSAIISALTNANSLVTFDSASPGTIVNTTNISGIAVGDSLVAIDYRPIDGQLIGFGYNSATGTARVYSLNSFGVATSLNANTLNIGAGLGRVTADYNPTANALRVVTSNTTGNNLRITAGGTGTLATDSDLNPANNGIRATAYSRNNAGGGSSGATTLFEIDGTNNRLVTQGSTDFFTGNGTSPNTGILSTVASLSGVNGSTIVGFDIFNAPGTAASSPGSAFLATDSQLFSLDLSTGTATNLGTIGNGFTILDIAAVPEPTTWTLTSLALLGIVLMHRLRKRSPKEAI